MYIIDRAVLQYRVASANCKALSVQKINGHTRMTFPKHFSFDNSQYVFICVPSVSLVEWHPFSIASAPDDDEIMLIVKDMGPNSYTGSLYQCMAKDAAVLMDSPQGCSPDLFKYKTVVFVAGGVGITPVSSFVKQIINGADPGVAVHLIWTVRHIETLAILPYLQHLVNSNVIHVSLFVSSYNMEDENAFEEKIGFPIKVASGRPNMKDHLADIGGGNNTVVFACGPNAMVDSARKVSKELSMNFYSEEFSF